MRRAVAFIMIILTLLSVPQDVYARAKKSAPVSETNDKKYASIIIDASTGATVSEKNADKRLHPASLTKVMTLMLLFEQLENGTMRLNDKIEISSYAASQQPSKLGLSPGSSIRIEDAILAVVTKSANDIATAIAEHVSGSESRFAIRMTRRAHEIGMSNTTFVNASGLHNPGQISTARDMATLARYVLKRYPAYYRYFGTKQFTYRGKTMTNHNRLMNTYPGMDGFKTGFVNASGFNLIASAKKDGRRLIGVVFGGRSWKSRNDNMASLLNAAFAKSSGTRYAEAAPSAADPPEVEPIPVVKIAPAQKADMPRPAAKPILKQTDGAGNIQQRDAASRSGLSDVETLQTAMLSAAPLPAAKPEPRRAEPQQQALGGGTAYQPQLQPQLQPQTLQLPPSYYARNDTQSAVYPVPAGSPYAAADAQPPVRNAAANAGQWSVQIGAYNSRIATDDALRLALTKLPPSIPNASPVVVPLETAEGFLYRARLGNLTREQANEACQYFRDCLPVAPR